MFGVVVKLFACVRLVCYRAYSGENRESGLEAFFAHVSADVVKPLAGKMPSASDFHPGIRRFSVARVFTTPTQRAKKASNPLSLSTACKAI